MRSTHTEHGISPIADEAQFVLQHKCLYRWFRKGAGQSAEWKMICKRTWGSDFVPKNVRALYWPQWKSIQVLNHFITHLITADEVQTKMWLLTCTFQGNIKLPSPQEPACNGKTTISRKAISGQTWKSQIWEGTAVPENRPGKAGVLDMLNHSTAVSAEPLRSLPALCSRRSLCSGYTGAHLLVCCVQSGWQMLVLRLWPPLHLLHGEVQHAMPSLLQLHGEKGLTMSLQHISTPCDPSRPV